MNNAVTLPRADDEPFNDDVFYERIAEIQKEIGRFDTLKLIDSCLRYLHAPVATEIQYLERHPWLILLLMKWVILDRRAFKHGRPAPTDTQTLQLMRQVFDLGEAKVIRMPNQFANIRLFFRVLAYQQFFFQRPSTITIVARQRFYYEELAPESYIYSTFEQLTGVSIPRFIELAQGVFIHFSETSHTRLGPRLFDSLHGSFSESEVRCFLAAISKTVSEVRIALLERDKDNISKGRPARSPAEFWEQTPFINYPLIKTGTAYVCWDRMVLLRSVEHYIYNRLRANNAKLFMSHFGPVFERYVERLLRQAGMPFISESEIKKKFGEESDAIDFIIPEGEANVFLDAKGVEMSYQGKTTHDSDELTRWLDTSALKAIKQAHKVMSKLPDVGDPNVLMRRRPTNYLVTVTYSELYVGSGKTLAESIGIEKLTPLMKTSDGVPSIPLEHMYFMTVKEFELMTEVVRSGQATLVELLDHAITDDSDPRTQKFDMGLHLESANVDIKPPQFLVERAVSDLQSLMAHIRHQTTG